MSSKGQAFALPSYDEIPLSEHRQTLKLVLEVTEQEIAFWRSGVGRESEAESVRFHGKCVPSSSSSWSFTSHSLARLSSTPVDARESLSNDEGDS